MVALLATTVVQMAWPVRAASVLPATDAALVSPVESPAEGADAEVGPGLDPAALLREIDLLLDLQVSAVDLGTTPADGPAGGGLAAAVDLDVLSPGLPANPRFPGYGLSYVLPAGPSRMGVDESHPAASDGTAQRGSSGRGGWFGLDSDGRLAEPIGEMRAWVASHRTELLIGLGLSALAVAAATSATSRAARARRQDPPRRRRRRSGGGGSAGSAGAASGSAREADGTSARSDRSRGARPRERSPSSDPATHRR